MAINLDERYPGRANPKTLSYPQGSFKNRTSPTSKDGTYLEQDWVNDWAGFFQRMMLVAGMSPNGSVDTAESSQYFDALMQVVGGSLGTAATRDITTSATDTTAGRVTTVGWMGLGGAIVVNSDIDWDTLQNSGFYSILTEEGSNRPTTRWGNLIVSGNASRSSQIYITDDSAQMYIRSKGSGSTPWSPWKETLHTGIFPPIGYCYTQYPNTPTPSELFGGTWTLMFNTEGVFFRTEGGIASSFGGGIQSDALQNITGDFFGAGLSSNPTGVFSRTTGLSGVRGDGADGARVSFDASRVARTSTETRPRNRTVRVWRKTAH